MKYIFVLLLAIANYAYSQEYNPECLVSKYKEYAKVQNKAYFDASNKAAKFNPEIKATINAWAKAQAIILKTNILIVSHLAMNQIELLETGGIGQLPPNTLSCGPKCKRPAHEAMMGNYAFAEGYKEYQELIYKYVFHKGVSVKEEEYLKRASTEIAKNIKQLKYYNQLRSFFHKGSVNECKP